MGLENDEMKDKKPGVLLVDDHALILQGIKFIVDSMSEIGEVCTASSAAEAMALIEDKTIDKC